MPEKITKDELADLFGESMPMDVAIILWELNSDLTQEERLAVLRRFLDQRAQDWYKNKLAIQECEDRIESLTNEVSQLRWQLGV